MVPKNLVSGAILRTHVISSQLWTLCLNLHNQWLLQRKPRYSKTYIKTYCEFIVSFLNSLLLGLLPLSHLLADHPLVLDAVAGKNRRGGLQRSWLLMVCCLWSHSWSTVMCYCNQMSPPPLQMRVWSLRRLRGLPVSCSEFHSPARIRPYMCLMAVRVKDVASGSLNFYHFWRNLVISKLPFSKCCPLLVMIDIKRPQWFII